MRQKFEHAVRRIAERCGFYVRRRNSQTDAELHIATVVNHLGIDLVLDVGANTGQFAQALRNNGYRGRIMSFEPIRSAHAALEAAARRDPAWKVAPRAALGDFEGEATLNISRNSVSSSLFSLEMRHSSVAGDSAYVGVEQVPVTTLDRVALQDAGAAKAVYLKIDTQGFEKKVLLGGGRIAAIARAIQLELSLVELYAGQPLFEEMNGYMRSLGFELFAVLPGFTDRKIGQTLQFDGIYVSRRHG